MNTAPRSTRMPRWIAVILTGALVALGSVVSVSPAAAADGAVASGSAVWGISTYMTVGSIGRPKPVSTAYTAPASYDATSKLSTWGSGTGTVNADGSATLSYSGAAVVHAPTGGGWIKLADLKTTISAAGNGVVSALVSYGTSVDPTTYDPAGVAARGPVRVNIVTLAGNSASPLVDADTASWSGLVGTWHADLSAFLAGDATAAPAIAGWTYASTITNTGVAERLPSTFAFGAEFDSYPVFSSGTYNSGSAAWGISTYMTVGSVGRPKPLPTSYVTPASYDSVSKISTWGNGSGTVNADGSATISYTGASVVHAPTGGGWLKLADIQATLDPSGNGAVSALVSYGTSAVPTTYNAADPAARGPERVTIVTLAGNAAGAVQSAGSVTWTNLAGTWSEDFRTYLAGSSTAVPAIPGWTYASTITNTGVSERLPSAFTFALGTVPLIATTTTLTTTSATSVLVGTDVALTAAVSPALAGSIQFANGSTALGSVPVVAGVANYSLSARTAGVNAITATFVPTDSAHYAGSVGSLSLTVNAPVAAAAGSLTWGVKQSLQTYVLGGGSISTSSGAGATGSNFTFPQTSSTGFNHSAATGTSAYSGKVTFSYPLHGFSIGLANPRVALTSASAGTLYVDVTYNGATTPGVAFASLGLGSATKSTTGTSSTFSNVTAILTAAGAASFAGFYSAGDALDSMSFVVGSASSGFAPTSKSTPQRVPATTVPATEGITLSAGEQVEGGEVTITAEGFGANEKDILVVIYSSPMLLGTVTADADGAAIWTGTLPTGLTGEHTLTFQGSVNRGVVLDIAPASVSTLAVTGCLVDDAAITWGFKESFRSYISGSIANGEWTVADGATYAVPNFGWSDGTGGYEPSDSTGELSFVGSIAFTGHGGVLNTTVANPTVRFVDADTAFLDLDVSGTTQDGTPVSQLGVEFVELDLSAATVETADEGTVTITDAPAALTSAGSAAFGTYETGEAFDPVTLVFSTGADCGEPEAAAAPTATPIDAEPTSSDFSWLLWVLLALVVIIVAVVVIVVVRRRSVTAS